MAVKQINDSNSLRFPQEATPPLNNSFLPVQDQTTSSLLVRVQTLATANEQLNNKLLELENTSTRRIGELEKRNLELEEKMAGLMSTFAFLLTFQNTQDQSEMPLYEMPVVPIQNQSLIEDNSSEDTPPPGFSRPPQTTFDEKVASAKHFLGLRDYFCARAYIHEAIQIDPENARAFAIESKICRMEGDFVGSLLAARRAIEMDPDNLMALVSKALALRFLGNFNEALMTSEAALSIKPRNQLALRCKLECQFVLRRPTDSLQTIDWTLQHFPNDHVAHNIKRLVFFYYPHLRIMGRRE